MTPLSHLNSTSENPPPETFPRDESFRAPAGAGRYRHSPIAYASCDRLTEAILYCTVVFGPWAFGTTQAWSVWTMNLAGYTLGALLVSKWMIRWVTGFVPSRWGRRPPGGFGCMNRHILSLAILTVLVLAYCAISAWNAAATYHSNQFRLEYHSFLPWLPHSYDRTSSESVFWQYLSLALTFWAVRDWLLGKTRQEQQGDVGPAPASRHGADAVPTSGTMSSPLPAHPHTHAPSFCLPARLRRLFWVLCLNGSLLAAEAITQRLAGSDKLLWLVQPRINRTALGQFGPYAYRSNTAQYLNLVWPLSAGFAWMLAREARQARRSGARRTSRAHVWLCIGTILMAAAPVVSTSRGGALIAIASWPVVIILLIIASRGRHWRMQVGLFLLFIVTLQAAFSLGWDKLQPRLASAFSDRLSGRLDLYANARRMAEAHPLFGTGPGTFAKLYAFYRPQEKGGGDAQVHNDWLETRITFGWLGFGLILLSLVPVLLNWFCGTGIHTPWIIVATLWVALSGCLLHARFDFPLQIHSVLALFLLLSCILSCLSANRRPI